MSNNSDPEFDRYAEMDFTDAKPVAMVPALDRLQARQGGKSRITIRVDNAVLAVFKARAEMTGGNYQTLINEALSQFAQGQTLADIVRETIRQELHDVRPAG
ncbi:MAG: BrnA antitoxin family protein [Thiotrichales bacterium]